MFLAASIPARSGQRVLEAGTGAGAALLCLAQRVPGLAGTGLEAEPGVAGLATRNLLANGFGRFEIRRQRLEDLSPGGGFDHAMTNPPWHESRATASPDPARELARRADAELPRRWLGCLARQLRPHGTLTVIVGAGQLAFWLSALSAAGLGSPSLFPLWPRAGSPAKLVLVRAIRGGRGPLRLLPGLALHQPDGAFTADAQSVLRGGAALIW